MTTKVCYTLHSLTTNLYSTAMTSKLFVVVDGSSYLYRAFHALPPLTNSKGQPTGAAYGVANMLKKLLKDYQPDYIAVVFDSKGKTFRDDLYDQYKAHRPAMPSELRNQIEPLHNIIQALGLPLLVIDGVEADDVIGTLAKAAAAQGMRTIISTGDKDMAQLVNDQITLINTMTGQQLDPEGVKNKFGIPPTLIVDYLTLIGDSVDNIPGIPNVGPKTAVKWLNEYGTLDNLVNHAADIKGKVGENLRENLDQIPLSRQLTTIHTDVPLPIKLTDLQRNQEDTETLISLFKELEFKTWLADLLKEPQQATTTPKTNYETIFDENQLQTWLKKLDAAESFSFCIKTTNPNYMLAEIVGLSWATESHQACYIPIAHNYLDAPQQLEIAQVLSKLKPLLENKQKNLITHNLKYLMSVLANHDINIQNSTADTMLESYVLDSTATRHDLDTLALKYLGFKTTLLEDIAGKGAKQIPFNEVAIPAAANHAAQIADVTLQLHQMLWPKLADYPGLLTTFNAIEMPLVPVLSRMERHGVLVDAALLKKQSTEISRRIQQLEQDAFNIAGEEFNLASPKQLQEIFYQKLKLPILQKTPTGQPSTSEDVLQELALDYPLPKVILEHRGLSKLKSTYTDRLPEQINPQTGRVHTSYNQAVAATGRLSSTDPNLQNIPIRNEEGRRIRKAFIAAPGYKIVSADYSQIELRLMAHFSNDPSLLEAFAKGWDIHRATAAEIFNLPFEQVTSEQRRSAKAINFGLLYGMSSFGLAKQLGVDRQAAQNYMDMYFARYPKVNEYMDHTRRKAHELGYVEGLLGRRLYLPEINARNMLRQKAAERAAINAPLQGTAADIIKKAMINIDAWFRQDNVSAHMIMQVHDELVFEIPENQVDALIPEIQKRMCNVIDIAVPLAVDIGVGNNWDEAH